MKPRLKPLREQVVVLMGASSGIGRQAALDFAKAGAKVVAAARDEEGLASLAAEIERAGGTVRTKTADTANFEEVNAVAEYAVATFGRIDTWVHLAAVSMYATFEQTSPEEWRRILDVNLNGQAYGAMAALPRLRAAGGGALIHISSIEARRALPYQSAYAASKHGLTGMLETIRLELQKERAPISVTEILPASINTPFFEKARTKLGVKPTGVPPMYDPRDVADAILHCAQTPTREFVVGGAGKLLKWTQEISPTIADKVLMRVAFEAQKTTETKTESAPDNLYRPLPQYSTVEGHGSSMSASYNWVEKHPIASKLVFVGALTAALTLMLREGESPQS